MSKTPGKVRRFIERHSMLKDPNGAAARRVVVAVSGGPDSIALLDILARLQPTDESRVAGESNNEGEGQREGGGIGKSFSFSSLTLPPSTDACLHVAHLDHKLRGRESAEDAEFVRHVAEQYGLSITVGEADVRAEAKRAGRGIEEVARELRYNFLLRVARETGCDRIATGHTMSDQAETFLMRLARGAGLRGLASMRPVAKAHAFLKDEGGRVNDENGEEGFSFHPSPFATHPLLIRPLLCITREEVEEYCREQKLEFRTDATNLSDDYTRNRVRRDVLPALRAINPRAAESIARAAEIISIDEDALDYLASSLLDGARLMRGVESTGGADTERRGLDVAAYSAAALLEQPVGLRRRMIIEAIRRKQAARSGSRSATAQITSTHIASIEGLLGTRASGKRISLPGGLDVWREFDAVVFMASARGDGSTGVVEYEYIIDSSHSSVEARGFRITLERNQPLHLLESIINQAREGKRRSGRDWLTVALDDGALPDCLVIRPRRAGERACILGQRRTKKLKNLMIDHKIPPSRRSAWPVMTTPDDRYVWSPCLPPALEFAARDKSTRLAILRASDI